MSLPSTSPLPSAFRIVRQILSTSTASEGLTTKELIKEALKLYQVENPNSLSTSEPSSSSSISENAVTGKGKGKGKNVINTNLIGGKKDKGVNVIPQGHPFVSTSFLKSRILATLQSQDLLLKSPRQPSSSSSSPSSSSSASSTSSTPSASSSSSGGGGGRPTFVWRLSTPKQSNLATSKWDFPAHWDRLIQGQSPGQLHAEYMENKESRKEEEKQRGFQSGKVSRNEREIWEWEDRKEGLTTNLERLHLNKRRAAKRPEKERRRIGLYESYFGNGGEGAKGDERLNKVV